MGGVEMNELGSIIALVLKGTKQAPDAKDPAKKSRAKYLIDETVKAEAIDRVKKLLERFPVYPELDLDLLKKAFAPHE
jgi:glycine hydroxymethyltransferase